MNKCPKCGRYMISYVESIFGYTRLVWNCPCGYSTKNESSAIPSTQTIISKSSEFMVSNHS